MQPGKKKKLLLPVGIVGACAIIGISAFALLPDMRAPVVSKQSYSDLMAEGAETVGYKILETKKEAIHLGQNDNYKFVIDYNGQPKTVFVDEATYNMYQAGNYVTCAYLLTGEDVIIAAKPIGRTKEGN